MVAKGSLRLLIALGGLLLGLAPLAAQDDTMKLLLGATTDATKARSDFRTLSMRPNQASTFFLFVRNDSTTETLNPTLTVTAEGDVLETDPPPPAPGAVPPPPPAANAPKEIVLKLGEKVQLPEIKQNSTEVLRFKLDKEWCLSPRSKLTLELADVRTKLKDTKTIAFATMKADDYLSFSPSLGTEGQLGITVTRKDTFRGPPSRLVLDPTRLTTWTPDQDAVLINDVDAQDKQSALLSIQRLRRPASGRSFGMLAVAADDVPRAKVFVVKAEEGNSVSEDDAKNVLRIVRRATAPAKDPKAKAKVIDFDFEVDNAPADASLRISVDLTGSGIFETRRVFPSPRKDVHCVRGGPDGGLSVRSIAGDWSYQLSTEGLQATVKLQAELLAKDGTSLAKETLPVVISSRPPRIVAFRVGQDKPTYAPGEEVQLVAQVTDDVGIVKAVFFVGDAPPMEAKPELTVRQPDRGAYAIKLALPEQKGKTAVGVLVENAEGLTAYKTLPLRVADPPPESDALMKPGSLKGKVVQGVDEIPQKGITVELIHAKDGVVKTATTKEDGTFEIKDIPPGAYQVSCARAIDKTKASAMVTIEAGKVLEMKDPLSLKR